MPAGEMGAMVSSRCIQLKTAPATLAHHVVRAHRRAAIALNVDGKKQTNRSKKQGRQHKQNAMHGPHGTQK